jgi:hypothetical protein
MYSVGDDIVRVRVEQRCEELRRFTKYCEWCRVPTGLQVSCQVKRRGPNALRH